MAANATKDCSLESTATVYAEIAYEDPYVQPLILSALSKHIPQSSYTLIKDSSELPSSSTPHLQILPYESIDFTSLLSRSSTLLANAYIIRKALIRKHYLSTTVSNWITKHPNSVLKKHVKPSVEFEVDYAEFLDDALVEAWELKESWARNEEKEREEREWWILKPGMSERGQGIRLFSSEEELTEIFEEWEEDEDDEDEDEDARSDTGGEQTNGSGGGNGIITSQLRHFIAQPYIHPPLLLPHPTNSLPTKFHIRTYVLCVGALKVYVYKPMLALFAAKPYLPPWEASNTEDALRAHLTNTCLQESGDREGSVGLFWELSDNLPSTSATTADCSEIGSWKEQIYAQIKDITAETFEAAARGMMVHFQPLPNAFEVFGLDFMVARGEEGELVTYLLEVNAFPDFRQTGDELKGLVGGLWEDVVGVGVLPFFGLGGMEKGTERLERVLDVDLGRR